MKITFNIECSPEEARDFMGLPNLQPVQEALVNHMQQHMRATMQAIDPQAMTRSWATSPINGLEQIQKLFWGQMQQSMASFSAMTGALCAPARKTNG